MKLKCPKCSAELDYKKLLSLSFTKFSICDNCHSKLTLKNPKFREIVYYLVFFLTGMYTFHNIMIHKYILAIIGASVLSITEFFWIKSCNVVLAEKNI
jgi:uncharacterized MnhB-related membrane protein